MLRTIARVVLASLIAIPVAAAPRQLWMTDFVQDVWDAGENGLPHPGVTALFQSRDGYLWIGTFRGVARFDGVDFVRPAIGDPQARAALADTIRCVFEGRDGAMWFGTRRAGAVRLKDGVARLVTKNDGLPSDEVRSIVETGDGTIWLATPAGLAAWTTSGVRVFGADAGLASADVVRLFVDADGTLWAGTARFGVARFDGRRFQTTVLDVPADRVRDQAFNLPFEAVGALARDADGVLWAGTSVGVMRVPEGARPGAPPVSEPAVNAMHTSRHGGLWVSTGAGLGRLRGDTWTLYTSREGLLGDDLMSVLEDHEGSLWIGTRLGLARLRPRIVRTYTQRDGLGGVTASCVLEARNGDLWVGHRNGVSRLSRGVWTSFGPEHGLPHAVVRALAETSDGAVWIGTLEGVARYQHGRMTVLLGEGRPYGIRGMATDRLGRLWITTSHGVDRLEGGRLVRVIPRSALCDQTLLSTLYVDGKDTLWIGSSVALTRIAAERMECLRDAASPTRNDIRAVTEDADGRLWVGSIGGLSFWNGAALEPLSGPGPFDTSIYGLLDDGQGAYWVSTPEGLFRIEKSRVGGAPATSEPGAMYRRFGAADGMDSPVGTASGVPPAWRGRDGRLYFTTATGIVLVDPSRIQPESYVAPVHVERLLADRNPVALAGRPRLRAGTRDVELRFAMLSFVAPDLVRYRYKLEGFDVDWVDSGNRRVAYYTNLIPGPYRFRVIAATHNGLWNDTGATLDFEVLPHFYERRGFRIAAALAIILVGFAGYTWRMRQMRAREKELERRVQEAVAQVHTLRGLLPICAACKSIRDDTGYWRRLETYLEAHSAVDFSHSICPACLLKLYPDYAERIERQLKAEEEH